METIAIFNTRGGSGKSAATVFLADFLSAAFRKRVLVVDLDPQQSSSVALLGEERMYEGFGRKKSLPHLMERAINEDLPPSPIIYSAVERPQYRGRKGVVYLAPIHVLACEREAWHDLNHNLTTLPPAERQASYGLLDKLLRKLDGEFDICLIDFPGHETGPICKNGLRAARWWLFPCVPDRSGIRDIQGPRAAIKVARLRLAWASALTSSGRSLRFPVSTSRYARIISPPCSWANATTAASCPSNPRPLSPCPLVLTR